MTTRRGMLHVHNEAWHATQRGVACGGQPSHVLTAQSGRRLWVLGCDGCVWISVGCVPWGNLIHELFTTLFSQPMVFTAALLRAH